MSYILEALKKAEQKRELEERQTSIAFSTEIVKPTRKMAWWPYVLIAVLVVNAFFLIRWVWFGPAIDGPAAAPPSPVADPIARPSELPTASVQEVEKAAPRIVVPAERTERKEGAGVDRAAQRTGPTDREVSETQTSPSPAPVAEPVPTREVRPSVERRGAPVAGKVYGLGELPGDLRSSLPEFRISGHAYSTEVQTRVVRINEKILQEGQELSAGLRLEEITPVGVILSFQGYRFRVGVSPVQ